MNQWLAVTETKDVNSIQTSFSKGFKAHKNGPWHWTTDRQPYYEDLCGCKYNPPAPNIERDSHILVTHDGFTVQGFADNIFESRDITLPTKVRLVKAMVFPVVMYGCESWTVKKAEHWKIDAFELWC